MTDIYKDGRVAWVEPDSARSSFVQVIVAGQAVGLMTSEAAQTFADGINEMSEALHLQLSAFADDLRCICGHLARAATTDGKSIEMAASLVANAEMAPSLVANALLDCAAGVACLNAIERLGREPDPELWRKATEAAFARAVKRTAASRALKSTQADETAATVKDGNPPPSDDGAGR